MPISRELATQYGFNKRGHKLAILLLKNCETDCAKCVGYVQSEPNVFEQTTGPYYMDNYG